MWCDDVGLRGLGNTCNHQSQESNFVKYKFYNLCEIKNKLLMHSAWHDLVMTSRHYTEFEQGGWFDLSSVCSVESGRNFTTQPGPPGLVSMLMWCLSWLVWHLPWKIRQATVPDLQWVLWIFQNLLQHLQLTLAMDATALRVLKRHHPLHLPHRRWAILAKRMFHGRKDGYGASSGKPFQKRRYGENLIFGLWQWDSSSIKLTWRLLRSSLVSRRMLEPRRAAGTLVLGDPEARLKRVRVR